MTLEIITFEEVRTELQRIRTELQRTPVSRAQLELFFFLNQITTEPSIENGSRIDRF